MASSNWSRVRRIVEEALELAPAERGRWLDSACGGDTSLRAEVDGLLAAEEHVDQLGESPFAGAIARVVPTLAAQPTIGAHIGAYELVGVIASGGMGTVYEALQRSPQRKVALKVMRDSLLTAAERSRFRFESEVLARLQHPNIAQVYESGVQLEGERGQRRETPYFAMEFVEGHRTLIEYAAEHELDVAARARLFLQVCDAVHHGHQKGVIHRDIKPSNLLVTPAGQVKVIDFGVARAVEQTEAARTLQTQSGQLIGTLGYMSPEQFGADPNAIDVRSDVYALGTVIYELVAGELPFALATKAVHEVARIVTLERPRSPRSLQPALPLALEWILLKALEKEPALRYASASELALDIERFLDHKPVLAGAPSVIHRMKLAIRRNRMASAIAALALLAIVTTSVIYLRSISAARARETQQLYAAMISAADAALRVNDLPSARAFLERAPVELRNWEWHHLHARQDESVRTWRDKGHLLAFHPTRDTLTAASVDALFEWVEGPSASPRTLLELEPGWLTSCMAWSPSGRHFALGSFGGPLRIYAADDEVRLQASADVREKVHCVAWSPDGARLAVASDSATIVVLDARSGTELATLRGHRAEVSRVLFDPSGERLYSSGTDTTVRVWDWRAGTQRVLAEFRDSAGELALSADGRILVAGSKDRSFRILDTAQGRELRRVEGLAGEVSSLALTRGSNRIVCGLIGGQLEVFDAATAIRVHALVGSSGGVHSVCVGPDDATIASSSGSGLKLWNLRVPASETVVRAHWGDIGAAAFDPRGRWLVTVGLRDCLVAVRDARTGRLLRVLPDHSKAVAVPVFSADGAWMATSDDAGQVVVWNAQDFTRVWTMPLTSDPSARLRSHAKFDGTSILRRCRSGRLERWRVGAESPDESRPGMFPADDWQTLEVDRGFLAHGEADGRVVVMRAADLAPLWSIPVHRQRVFDLAISPDGRHLASVSEGGGLVVQDLHTGEVLASTFETGGGDSTQLSSVGYSPDGTRLVVGSWTGFVRLFDTRGLQPILSFRCSGSVQAVFSPDGDALAAAAASGDLFVWRRRPASSDADRLDFAPSLLARAESAFAEVRGRHADLEDALAVIEAERELEPELKEAVLARAHRERASKHELLERALRVLVADDPDAARLQQAINRARALRRVENSDPDALLASALARLRDPGIEPARRWPLALSGLERAQNSALEHGDRVWAAACAGQAIALAHMGRMDEARAQVERARACTRFEPAWSALLSEADALLANEGASAAGQPVR